MGSLKEHAQAILIVDDNINNRETLRGYIQKYTQEFPHVTEVDGVAQALLAIHDEVPLCCIIHYRLGVENDQALLKRIRQDYPPDLLPIIIITEQNNEESAVHLLQCGVQNYLLKEEMTASRLYGTLCDAIRSSTIQKELDHLAHYDSLTGLLNRNLLMNRLEQALKRCDRYKQRCALLYLNLDNFKPINETYGHDVGDRLLQIVGERIKRNCRSTDSPARMGGDEFVVLIEHVENNTGRKVAEKILRALSSPFDIEGHSLLIGASIGLATYPDTAKDANELLKQADQALSSAKDQDLVNFVNFSEKHKHQWTRQHILETELPRAIARGELSLVYQPIVHAETFELKRLEVLSRWPRSDYAVHALELMEMIDRLNLIEPFHEWLFDNSFNQIKKWEDEGIHPDLCLNIPANYCYSPSISNRIKHALELRHIPPQKIELEITESTLMRFPEKSVKVMQGLHDYGLRIAIDDFGTGYSSMAYLTQLPLDTLKIDRNFFLTTVRQDRNRKIIEAITALGHSLDLEIIAEGVETDVQLQLAREVGCDLLQGYYFGRPEFPGCNWSDYSRNFDHFIVPQSLKGK